MGRNLIVASGLGAACSTKLLKCGNEGKKGGDMAKHSKWKNLRDFRKNPMLRNGGHIIEIRILKYFGSSGAS